MESLMLDSLKRQLHRDRFMEVSCETRKCHEIELRTMGRGRLRAISYCPCQAHLHDPVTVRPSYDRVILKISPFPAPSV